MKLLPDIKRLYCPRCQWNRRIWEVILSDSNSGSYYCSIETCYRIFSFWSLKYIYGDQISWGMFIQREFYSNWVKSDERWRKIFKCAFVGYSFKSVSFLLELSKFKRTDINWYFIVMHVLLIFKTKWAWILLKLSQNHVQKIEILWINNEKKSEYQWWL